MKTDRELLELAAKAAGVVFTWKTKRIQTGPADTWGVRPYREEQWPFMRAGLFWNPLTDDGDALRLAVNLNIIISYSVDCTVAYAKRFDIPDQDEWTVGVHGEPEDGLPDMHEATRRAIVRAAAAIGEAMQ